MLYFTFFLVVLRLSGCVLWGTCLLLSWREGFSVFSLKLISWLLSCVSSSSSESSRIPVSLSCAVVVGIISWSISLDGGLLGGRTVGSLLRMSSLEESGMGKVHGVGVKEIENHLRNLVVCHNVMVECQALRCCDRSSGSLRVGGVLSFFVSFFFLLYCFFFVSSICRQASCGFPRSLGISSFLCCMLSMCVRYLNTPSTLCSRWASGIVECCAPRLHSISYRS